VSYAAITAEKAMPWLDTHVRAWGEARRELCLDARVRGTVDDAALERALWCLDDRRIELEALVEELAHADAPLIRHAVRAAVGLSRIETCRDAGLLRRLPLPPPRLRSEARTASVELLRAGALERAGRFDDARTLVQAAADRADGLGWPPLAAAVRVQLGSLLEREGRYAEAEAAFEAAYFEAATAGAAQTAADAADRLTFTVGYRLSRHAEGLRWSRLAEVELERLGTGEDLRRAEHLDFLVPTLHGMGDYSQAGATAERVLAIREPLLGPDHPDVGSVLDNIGISRHQAGELQQARELHERAIEIARRALGPEHPDVAMSLHNLALVYRDLGDRDGARARYEESLAVAERALGPDHVDVAQCLDGLASTHYAAGEYEQARALYERALPITEKSLGPDHPQVATSLASLGAVARMTGDLALAQRRLERALAIRERAFGGEHPQVAATLNSLGVVAVDQGDVARGRRLHERALTIREKALGPGHLEVAASLMNVASVHRAAGDWVAMVAPLERAVAIYAAHEGAQPNELKARFALAEALVASGGDGTRARALAQGAREGWLAGAQADPAAVAKVDTWLAAHARRSPDAE
jgi:serine/threonine-protein kinase